MTRLLAAAVLLALAAGLVGCSLGCSLPNSTLTTTDGVTVTGDLYVDSDTVSVYGPQGNLTVVQEKVLRIDRAPGADANTRRTP